MKTRMTVIIGVCGTMLGASTALAQTRDADRQPTTTKQPARNADRQGPTNILNDMQGVWRVDVRINPTLWGDMDRGPRHDDMNKDDDKSKGKYNDNDKYDDNDKYNDNDKDASDNSNAPKDKDAKGNGTDRNKDAPRARDAAHNRPSTMTGMAETRLILDGAFLQQRVSFAGQGAMHNDKDAMGAGASTASPMHALAFFGFDPQHATYSAVFMNGRDGSMYHDTGTYDATARRLVFNGRDASSAASAGRDDDDRAPDHARTGRDDVRVVVEILGNDRHRVTMYAGAENNATDRRTETPAARAPGATNPADTTATGALPANVVYQATYTRVSDAEASRYRRALEDADAAERGNTSPRDADPDKNVGATPNPADPKRANASKP